MNTLSTCYIEFKTLKTHYRIKAKDIILFHSDGAKSIFYVLRWKKKESITETIVCGLPASQFQDTFTNLDSFCIVRQGWIFNTRFYESLDLAEREITATADGLPTIKVCRDRYAAFMQKLKPAVSPI